MFLDFLDANLGSMLVYFDGKISFCQKRILP